MDTMKRKGSPAKGNKTKKKAKKETDGIKKPTSAYIYFVSDYRLVLKKKGVDTSKVKDVAKLCGAAWKAMSDEEKAPYLEKYQKDRSRYMKEREVLDKKMGKDPTKPKRPQTAYFFFLSDFRKEMAGKENPSGEKIPTLAGKRWGEMSVDDKKKYEEMVEKDKLRYEKAMEEWKKTNPEEPKKPVSKKKVEVVSEEESSEGEDSDESDSETDSDDDN